VATAAVVAAGGSTPLPFAPPAAADPCSVPPGAQALPPGQRPVPSLPVPHLPIGRKPGAPQLSPQAAAVAPQAAPVPSGPQFPQAPMIPQAPLLQQAALIPTTALAQPAALVPPPGVSTPPPAGAAVPALAPAQTSAPQVPAPAAAVAATATQVAWVNGPNSPNSTYTRFGMSGADLGIMWDNGMTGPDNQILIAFGDTFGNCSVPGQEWRSNTLFRSSDRNLADGISVPDPVYGNVYAGSPVSASRPNFSRQVIDSLGLAQEVTVIPTTGISVGTTQYVGFMSVAAWGNPGSWSTNFSAIAVSNDNGETWTVPRSSIRPSWFFSVPSLLLSPNMFIWGYQNFQQGAFVRKDGYVYAFGTGAGRGGMAFVSRVKEDAVTNVWSYEYYSPWGWTPACPFCAIQVIWDATSEMSVAWNDYLNKFVVLYTNALNNVVMRTADKPEGPWSDATTLVTSAAMPGLYAPFIHPWSSGRDLYFNLSLWGPYSVALMHTQLG
jgi:hypothetical protein